MKIILNYFISNNSDKSQLIEITDSKIILEILKAVSKKQEKPLLDKDKLLYDNLPHGNFARNFAQKKCIELGLSASYFEVAMRRSNFNSLFIKKDYGMYIKK